MKYDLSITGSWGLYSCVMNSQRARRWVEKNVESERIGDGNMFYIEGGDRCREIVAGAVKAKLRVEVNGLDMKGFQAA